MGVTNAASRPAAQPPRATAPAQPKPSASVPAAAPSAAPRTAAAPAQQPRAAAPAPRAAAPQSSGPGRRSKVSFGDSTPRGSRANLEPIDDHNAATYTVRVNRVERKLAHESKHPQPAESTIIELIVETSSNPKCPAGYTASVVFTDRYFQDLYFGEVKGFLCGLLNASPSDIDDNDWNTVAGRFDLLAPEGVPVEDWLASDEVVQMTAWREGTADQQAAVIGALVNVTVRYKLRKDKHPIREYAWTTNDQQHPEAATA